MSSSMDAHAHCAQVVRSRDRDRYIADLFAPEATRRHLFALHAFNAEVAQVRDLVSEPMPGEIRLQWWQDVLSGSTPPAGNPVATALMETMAAYPLPTISFENLIEARRFDLYDDPMPSLNDLEGYAGETSSALIQLSAIVLAGGQSPENGDAAGHAGVAYAITGLLRALPRHARRGQCYLPTDLMSAFAVGRADLHAGRSTPALLSLLSEMRSIARRHEALARRHIAALPEVVKPAFLPLALVGPVLDRMERADYDPFRLVDLPIWRRQWILWRASRRM